MGHFGWSGFSNQFIHIFYQIRKLYRIVSNQMEYRNGNRNVVIWWTNFVHLSIIVSIYSLQSLNIITKKI